MYIFYIFVAFFSIIALLYFRRQKPATFPPGYSGVPFLGVIPFLSENPAETLRQWGKSFGSVFYVQLGLQDVIILNNFAAINECFVTYGKLTSDRDDFRIYNDNRKGAGFTFQMYTPALRTMRKHLTNSLKGFGNDKDYIEKKIHEELDCLWEELSHHQGESIDPKITLCHATSSVLTNICFGKRLGYDDPRLLKMLSLIDEIFVNEKDHFLVSLISVFYQLRYFPVFSGAYKRVQMNLDKQADLFRQVIHEHELSFDENNIRDFIDLLLYHKKQDSKNPTYSDNQILRAVSDLFEAGTDTSANTLRWCVQYLVMHPNFQEELFDEIVYSIGERKAKHSDRENLPKVCSFIDEISRHRTIGPLSVLHRSSEKFKLFEFDIPKTTIIISNLWAHHRDPGCFPEPDSFIPDRFINKESGKFIRSKYHLIFGTGPRKCPGFQLAEKEVFIFLCGILQKFKIKKDKTCKLPSFNDGISGLIYIPKPFKVIFCER